MPLHPDVPVDDDPPVIDSDLAGDHLADDPGWGRWDGVFVAVICLALVLGIVLRFVTRSPLWLDEALSVDIARLPLGDITEALRHDGHPPLYYVLLHGWIAMFGEGDVAVRSLSGVFGVLALPLLWLAGRRLGGARVGWYALAVAALLPYALRYSTETRMYSLVMLLVLAGWLLLDDALHRPTWWRLGGLAAVVALLLWTHYWSMWLLAVAGLVLIIRLVRAHRGGRPDEARATRNAIIAIVVGGLAFVPWLGNLLYQGAHTGTPWARPVRPTEMLTFTLADLGGGGQAEAIVLGWFVALLALTGLMGRRLSGLRLEVDLRTRPTARPLAIAVVGTVTVGCIVGYATGSTYAGRYAAVFVPFVILLAALGLAQLAPRVAAVGLLALFALGMVGAYRNVTVDRSDARRSAAAIEARGRKGDLVLFCPDQLGPSTARVLGDGFDEVTYPDLARPELVDWTDYTERLEKASPEEVARQVLERAGDRQIFLVYSTDYITHRDTCPALFNAIGAQRPPEVLTSTTEAWEPSAVVLFAPPKP